MEVINIHDAKTNFSKLVDRAAAGEEIIIAKAGKPAASLVPIKRSKPERVFGSLKGKIRIADDFDAALSEEILAAFEGV